MRHCTGVPNLPNQLPPASHAGHMVVCGDDALAYRLVHELSGVYGTHVTALVPSLERNHAPRIAELGLLPGVSLTVLEALDPDEATLRAAGVDRAVAVALTYEDDQTNIHAALRARRLNPDVRLVIRMFNRKLGRHLGEMLERASAARSPQPRWSDIDASITVLSDADTAAPALVAAAVVGSSKVVQADGLLLRAAERPVGGAGSRPHLCTLALLPDPVTDLSRDDPGADPQLLPDDAAVSATDDGRSRVVLEAITRRPGPATPRRRLPRGLPMRELFSRRLRWTVAGLAALQGLLAVLTWQVSGEAPLRAAYLSMLDLLSLGDPALGEPTGRQVLQLLSGLSGMALLPVLFAIVVEALGAFRTATALRPPPRGLSGHIVLLGLGKVGSRVLDRLHALDIDVVCVEQDPQARGVVLARSLRVPVIIGDATQEGLLEAAKIGRSRALLALTSSDSTNLEAALYARESKAELRVVMRLFDDEFATVVSRTLRASYPRATTRSRSVSTLAAPAFAGAMMGRQILGAIPIERHVLLFAAVDVRGLLELEGRTIAEAFRPGAWRVLALDLADPAERRPDLSATPENGPMPREPELAWEVPSGYVLRPEDRVVLAATRHGLARLLRHAAQSAHSTS
ncbi:Trk K+ transport system NAD-binding subunit [Streptomyces sp. SPB162]|nr:Trk K+ transport system NAD-binding subunit [Streptomyces sp. SPB162]